MFVPHGTQRRRRGGDNPLQELIHFNFLLPIQTICCRPRRMDGFSFAIRTTAPSSSSSQSIRSVCGTAALHTIQLTVLDSFSIIRKQASSGWRIGETLYAESRCATAPFGITNKAKGMSLYICVWCVCVFCISLVCEWQTSLGATSVECSQPRQIGLFVPNDGDIFFLAQTQESVSIKEIYIIWFVAVMFTIYTNM